MLTGTKAYSGAYTQGGGGFCPWEQVPGGISYLPYAGEAFVSALGDAEGRFDKYPSSSIWRAIKEIVDLLIGHEELFTQIIASSVEVVKMTVLMSPLCAVTLKNLVIERTGILS